MLKILTLNIHKGFSAFNIKFTLCRLKAFIKETSADLVLLQEVIGENTQYEKKIEGWPNVSQYEYLADSIWPEFAYGKNSEYTLGHHGNALLSKYPILDNRTVNVSAHSLEQRGFLYCKLDYLEGKRPVHAICVHLALFHQWRLKQIAQIKAFIEENIPANEPLILAGDFNDWSGKLNQKVQKELCLKECFDEVNGVTAKTFPVWFPFLSLDRVYYRGFKVEGLQILKGNAKTRYLSDHCGLLVNLNSEE